LIGFHRAIIVGDEATIRALARSDTAASRAWADAFCGYWLAKSRLAKVADEKIGGMSGLIFADEQFVIDFVEKHDAAVVPPLLIVTFAQDRGKLVLRWMGELPEPRWQVDFESAAKLGAMTPEAITEMLARFGEIAGRFDQLTAQVAAGKFTSPNALMREFNRAQLQ